jgi:glycosyltransferase involved in cell wall biosynthesis
MAPSISIITPSLNQGDFIERAIRSVLNQDISGLEYVVVDGGSTDKTLNILRRFEGRVNWISGKDKGQADAVNKGIRETKGEIIGWLNSDDMYYPGSLAAAVSFFDSHPGVDVVYGEGDHIDIEDRVIEPYPTEFWSYERLKAGCFLCQPAVFFRRAATTRFGLLNDRLHYCLDYEFWLRLAGGGATFFHMEQPLAATRLHPVAKTLRMRLEAVNETIGMLYHRLGHVPDEWLLNYARIFLNRGGERRLQGGQLDRPLPETVTSILRARRFWTLCMSPPLALSAVVVSLFASLRWNRSISGNMLRILARWIRGHGRQVIGGAFSSGFIKKRTT